MFNECRWLYGIAQKEALMSQSGSNQGTAAGRRDLVDQAVIAQFVGKVEPGGEVSLAAVLGSVAFSLLVVFVTTAWWMFH